MFSAILTGLVMSFVRMAEPYFFFLIKQEFFSWFGILVNEKDREKAQQFDPESDSLAAQLQSSLNVELVNVILKSISDHCSGKAVEGTNYKDFDE